MNDQKYFGGEASNLGVVSLLPARNFKELVEQQLSATVTLSITKGQFFGLDGKKRDAAKQVPYLVPSSFVESPSRRITANAKAVSLVCLDIDPTKGDKDKPVQYPAAPIIKNPDLLAKQLAGYNFALYQTAQSTPAAPRARVIVEADNLPLTSYRYAVQFIAKLIGLPFITPESGVTVQAMFRPTTFSDTDTEKEHPLVVYRTDGRALKVSDFAEGGDFPAFETKGGTKAGEDISGDALAFLRPPVEGASFDEVKDSLNHISPDIPYRDWLEVAAALKHQFPAGDLLEKAYQLFDEWSARGEKYQGQEETRAKWDSFRPTPIGRVPVTIRSVFHRAFKEGWDSSTAKQRCFSATKKFIAACPTLEALLSDTLNKIIVTPLLSSLDEEGLLYDIQLKAKENFEHRVGLASLRKELKRRKAIVEKAKETEKEKDAPPPSWALGVCYVEKQNVFYRFSNKSSLTEPAFNNAFSRHLLPSKETLEASGQANSLAAAARPIVEPSKYLLNLLQVNTAYDFFYDPRKPNTQFVIQDNKVCVNTFRADYPEPEQDQRQAAEDMIRGHLKTLIAEPEYRTTLLDFMAYMVQFPGVKIRWGVLIQGAEGCGKGFLENVMRILLGDSNVKRVGTSTLFSNWTDWAVGHQLICLNEIRVAGHSRYDVMNKLKEPLSDDFISIEKRHTDSFQVENLANYFLYTNYHDALALSPNERRYFVVKSPIQSEKQVLELKKQKYFDKLFRKLAQLKGGLRAFFEDYEISEDFPVNGPAPVTPYLEQMKADTTPEAPFTVNELLAEGSGPLVQPDLIVASALVDKIRAEGVRVSPQQVSSILRGKGYTKAGRYRVNGSREFIWLPYESPLEGMNLGQIATTRLTKYEQNQTEQIFEDES